MNMNISTLERPIRAAVGVALIAVFFFVGNPLGFISAAAGLILVVTAAIGWCPIYRTLGLNFHKK